MDERRVPATRADTDRDDETELDAIEAEDSAAQASTPLAPRRKGPLTHRPRAQAELSAEAVAASLAARARKADASLPQRDRSNVADLHGEPKVGRDVSPQSPVSRLTPATDLRPFADQLVAIAEQLRSGDFQSPDAIANSLSSVGKAANAQLANAQTAQIRSIDSAGANEAEIASLSRAQRRKVFADMARATYAKRRKRSAIFGDPELFGEPGWDILLDLYIAQAEEKPVSVSSACIGSASPPTTGLRWLGVLAEQGLIEREHDPEDQRRVLVHLTQKGLSAMDEYFSSSASTYGDRRAARA
ncbi:MAG: winged helix DNA-binding protein [Erythrobacter sp.]